MLSGALDSQLSVHDTIVHSNGGTGIGIAADASVVVDHVRSEQNACDGFYIAPGATLARATITDSIFSWNGCNGVSIESISGADTIVAVERSTLSENSGSGLSAIGPGSGEVTVARSTIVRNADAAVSVTSNGDVVRVMVSQNTVTSRSTTGVRADGSGAGVSVSGNSFSTNGGFTLQQKNLAGLGTYGDNVGGLATSGLITTQTAQ